MIDPKKTALLTIDLQNDFLLSQGAYGRAGQTVDVITKLPEHVLPVKDALRSKGGLYISAQFTLVPGPGGEPLIAEHLQRLRPFLGRGDFEPGAFGHALVDALQPADFTIEKVAYSAFYQTRLEYILKATGVEHLLVAGIVTNGGVASTLRDAHLRGIETTMLTDGCAAFDETVHEATLLSLKSVTHQATCAEMLEQLQ